MVSAITAAALAAFPIGSAESITATQRIGTLAASSISLVTEGPPWQGLLLYKSLAYQTYHLHASILFAPDWRDEGGRGETARGLSQLFGRQGAAAGHPRLTGRLG